MSDFTGKKYRDITENDYSYEDLVDSLGYDVLVMGEDGDYQGDLYFLLRDENKFALLIFGCGSCSGCDELEANRSSDVDAQVRNFTAVRDDFGRNLVWLNSSEMIDRLSAETSKLQWYGHMKGFGAFRSQAMALLTE